MTFAWPAMLWLLLLVPLLAAAHVLASRRRQAALRRAASVLRLADAAGRGPGGKRHVPAALFLLAVAVGVVALSRPSAPVLLPGRGGTVILSIDVSGSMRARDIVPSRMEAVRNAARSFARAQPVGVRVGVVAFSSSAFLVQAPTTNRSAVLAAIDRLQPQMFTAIGSGLLTALDAIFPPAPEAGSDPTAPLSPLAPAGPPAAAPGSYPSAAIILLSDGQSNQGPDPLDAAQAAALRGVRVFTIGVGTREGTNLSFGGFTEEDRPAHRRQLFQGEQRRRAGRDLPDPRVPAAAREGADRDHGAAPGRRAGPAGSDGGTLGGLVQPAAVTAAPREPPR